MAGKPRKKKVSLSLVIPVFDEEENVELLYERLKGVLVGLDKEYEVIFVDDGSTDGTYEKLVRLRRSNDKVKIVRFTRNFGKAAAYMAGFDRASGEVIVTLDGDLQDDPKDIPALLEKLDAGYDLVTGWKWEGKGPIGKALPSRIFNRITSMVTGIKLHDFNCPLRVCRRDVANSLNLYGDLYRFIPVFAYWKGYRIGEVRVKNLPRRYGRSKYGLERLIKGQLDLLTIVFTTRFLKRPLHIFGSLGFVLLLLGVLVGLFLSGGHVIGYLLMGRSDWMIRERPLLTTCFLLIIMGFQFASLGLLGEMIAREVASRSRESLYVVREAIGFGEKAE